MHGIEQLGERRERRCLAQGDGRGVLVGLAVVGTGGDEAQVAGEISGGDGQARHLVAACDQGLKPLLRVAEFFLDIGRCRFLEVEVADRVATDLVAPVDEVAELLLLPVGLAEQLVVLGRDVQQAVEGGLGLPSASVHRRLQDTDRRLGVKRAVVQDVVLADGGVVEGEYHR